MAKKKQAAGSGGAMTKSRAKKSFAGGASASSNAKAEQPSTARASGRNGLSNTAIGEAAGQLWQKLSEGGPQSVAALKKSMDASDELVLLALGWLAREDKLEFQTSGRSTTVSLRGA